MKTRRLLCALLLPGFAMLAAPALGPLRVHPTNPRYFTDGRKGPEGTLKAVYLTGSHTWGNLTDGTKHPQFDFAKYLDFLDQFRVTTGNCGPVQWTQHGRC